MRSRTFFLVVLLGFAIAACNGGGAVDTSEAGTGSVSTEAKAYSVEHGRYVGTVISASPATLTLDEFTLLRLSSAGGVRGASLQHFRATADDGARQDLILFVSEAHRVTDSLLLSGDTTYASLGVSCVGSNPVVLVDNGDAVQAWKATADGELETVPVSDITSAEIDSCVLGP